METVELTLPEDDSTESYFETIMRPNDNQWDMQCDPFEMSSEQVQKEFEALGEGKVQDEQFELLDDPFMQTD